MSNQAKTQRVHVPVHDYDMLLKTYQLQCAWCGQQATVTTYPGRPPRFCSTDCATEARKAHDRARKAAGQPPAPDMQPDGRRRRGRPQKYPRLTLSTVPGATEPAWPSLGRICRFRRVTPLQQRQRPAPAYAHGARWWWAPPR